MNKTTIQLNAIKDLENIFKQALSAEKFSAAIKAKETQLKELNCINNSKNKDLDIDKLSDRDLEKLLEQISKKIKLDK